MIAACPDLYMSDHVALILPAMISDLYVHTNVYRFWYLTMKIPSASCQWLQLEKTVGMRPMDSLRKAYFTPEDIHVKVDDNARDSYVALWLLA